DSRGKITRDAPFQKRLASGTVARVEPHRKWFGNTRIVGQEQLQKFQEGMKKIINDPFQVVMKQTKLPISLLSEKADRQRVHVLDTESYEYTFGKSAQRKKPNIHFTDLEEFCKEMEGRIDAYSAEKDRDLVKNEQFVERAENPNPLFRAGQSNRVWGELYKVLDSSDVVAEVIDARDPMGTRCLHVERFLRKEKPHKHVILIINKIDLVPTWVTKKWLSLLSKELPTIVFHASMQHSFGKSSLINLLRQFAKLHKDRQQISVGFIGYPNVGKSSVVNTLRAKHVCKTAPIAGETKVWQYVTLMKRIYLIDCPGVVYPQGDSETQLVLKGIVRVENIKDPENHVQGVLDRVTREHLKKTYLIDDWQDAEDFLTKISFKTGRLSKGGEPDFKAAAKGILNDFQRGVLPYFVTPPGCEEETKQRENTLPAEEDLEQLEGENVTGESPSNIEKAESSGVTSEAESDDGSLTEIESTCSGLSDLSGVSDLDVHFEDAPEGVVDFGMEEDEEPPKKRGTRKRSRRAGKKLTEKRKRLQNNKKTGFTELAKAFGGNENSQVN
ncbi:unnamed protein product, partial [Enterobius vermicularis]|uniref:Nucleolar GTP-binding protein 2 n=1 Tax=Enterobius vermicularis TaxID=51028 RepID=A0A0N4VLR5_ENTVE